MIVDCAIYDDGRRAAQPATFEEALATARAATGSCGSGCTSRPRRSSRRRQAFDLHPLAVEDAIHAHQRPKLERYGDSLFIVLKPARYVDSEEVVELGQIMVFLGADFVVTVRHGESTAPWPSPPAARGRPGAAGSGGRRSCSTPSPTRSSTTTHVVMRGLDIDIDEIEHAGLQRARRPPTPSASSSSSARCSTSGGRSTRWSRPLAELGGRRQAGRRARRPTTSATSTTTCCGSSEHLAGLDDLLDSALNANVAQVGMRQNEDMRKISAWVAIIAVPTHDRRHLRHELRAHARARVGGRLPARARRDGRCCSPALRDFKHRHWL